MILNPLVAVFVTTLLFTETDMNHLLQQAYQDLPREQHALYVIQSVDLPPPDTPPTESVPLLRYPFVPYSPEDISRFLHLHCDDRCALSPLQFIVIDRRTKSGDGTVLYARSEPGNVDGRELEMVRLEPHEMNLIPVAVEIGAAGFDEVREAAGLGLDL
ncbi:hypothetical protein ASPCAL05112 [Aspergillus calidoustus]|uniref:Uncharacterized protein n=1 Tax=Aspergillus calidoustus TaxID=454130 RepID=A0A0U5C6G6_ASPCI|nr:hypothetical protein ASPCAL05112 [Aspergillus calidoustus]